MSAELREVPEFKNVFVNREGKVFTFKDGEYTELPRTRDDRGNCLVALRVGGKSRKRFVNKIVVEAFGETIGLDPRQFHVMHEDGDRFNCRLENLTILKTSPLAGRSAEIDSFVNRKPKGNTRVKV